MVLDGLAARYFDQCSNFGAVLDMVTDRVCTAMLLLVLSHVYTDYAITFSFLVGLDVGSHWVHMYRYGRLHFPRA